MQDEQLLRYSRQIMLPDIDIVGQQRLNDARVLIFGMGGLGSPVAMYLAAAGIGHLTLVDFDTVELSNLQRQIIHTSDDLGRSKVESARQTLMALNPETTVVTLDQMLDDEALYDQIRRADVVVDGTDNLTSRFAINAACVATGTPLVSGAAIRLEGQVMVYRPDRLDAPCYRCLYRSDQEIEERCAETGVLAPLVGIIGSVQALETIKLIVGFGDTVTGRLLLLDAFSMEWQTIKINRNPNCPVCSTAT